MWPFNKSETESPITKTGLSMEEYAELYTFCSHWYTKEKQLNKSNVESDINLIYYNIASFNLCRLGTPDVDLVFQITNDDRALTRFIQIYLQAVLLLGRERMTKISNDLQEELIALKVKKVRESFEKFPYLVLIPILNIVVTKEKI